MADLVIGGCLSHSPLINKPAPAEEWPAIERFNTAAARLGSAIRDSGADVIVIFGQDHIHSFRRDNMPAFCIGVDKVSGWGDWGTPVGPFAVEAALADHIARALVENDFDPLLSYDLGVDHGITQPLATCALEAATIVPILINTAAPPLPTPKRCVALGAAVGRAIASWDSKLRVAVIGSGGLSHTPPGRNAESEVFAEIQGAVHGRRPAAARCDPREEFLVANYHRFVGGIRPEWDRMILDSFAQGNAEELALRLDDAAIEAGGGSGGQEIRAWFAAAGALGNPCFDLLGYEPIQFYIAGMGVVLAQSGVSSGQ